MGRKGELIVSKRYAIRNESDEPMESMRDVFVRGAYAVATPFMTDPSDGNDALFDDATQHTLAQQRFVQAYKLMASAEFMPNSPFFTGAMRPLGNVMACFVLPIEDDLALGDDSIFGSLRRGTQIQQTGGGNGFSFSRLRPKNSFVSTSCGRSTGPVGFMKVYDVAFGMVAQGGTRRGANMAVLRVDHPDILRFIECKAKEGDISNFNISVGITNTFMRAVETGGTHDLIDPHTRRIVKTVDARLIYDKIVEHAHANGEPGVLFLDTANEKHPLRAVYELEATNPCGEQFLGPYENCCLGSINMLKVYDPKTEGIDWEKLKRITQESTRMLDSIVTIARFPFKELRRAADRTRRIGLGMMNLATLLYKLGVGYGTAKSCNVAAALMEWIRYWSMMESVEMAKEQGSFELFDQSSFSDGENSDHGAWIPTPRSPRDARRGVQRVVETASRLVRARSRDPHARLAQSQQYDTCTDGYNCHSDWL